MCASEMTRWKSLLTHPVVGHSLSSTHEWEKEIVVRLGHLQFFSPFKACKGGLGDPQVCNSKNLNPASSGSTTDEDKTAVTALTWQYVPLVYSP